MIQLDSDSTYGSTVSVNLGSQGIVSATFLGTDTTGRYGYLIAQAPVSSFRTVANQCSGISAKLIYDLSTVWFDGRISAQNQPADDGDRAAPAAVGTSDPGSERACPARRSSTVAESKKRGLKGAYRAGRDLGPRGGHLASGSAL